MAAGQFAWDWPILVEEYVFGLAAGLAIVAVLLSFRNWQRFSSLIKTSITLSAVLAVVGMITLIVELGRPERAAYAIVNLLVLGTSVMSRTVPVLMIFTAAAVVAALFWIKPASLVRVRRFFEIVLLLSAFPAGLQAGILLMAASKRLLWQTPVLPYLYLFTGILAAIGVVGLLIIRSRKLYEEFTDLLVDMNTYTVVLLVVSGLATIAHLVFVESPAAVLTLLTNPFPLAAPMFYIGYLAVGLGLPATHSYIALAAKTPLSRNILIRLYISLIVGALALRVSILYAGQLY
ncbi:MAG: NrfD/PsrC family molybdoenzyme membrane anchor subunit [Candidatus Caldarchaeum sp.]|nr:NrfD/PsrC family molybdoenzyme membrane anchor subunit [Candidatus Caldarchaeum sp.]MDW8360679.1 NrfD/PsrC family molybdoenzyme membrane anchor subunit [Candidatus Caldarchaeum sp.]